MREDALTLLEETAGSILPAPHPAPPIRAHVDRLTKPVGSLGRLEDLAVRLGCIYGDPPPQLHEVVVFVLAADHGVTAQGVSAYPAEVTAQMCANFSSGGAAINVLARAASARVVVADFGVADDLSGLPGVLNRKVGRGTADLSLGPAMSRADATIAIARGIQLVTECTPIPDAVVIGEMGIGNTTSASALVSAFTGAEPHGVVGTGTGIGADQRLHKTAVVTRALERLAPDADAISVLAQLGGFEIAGMAGVALGAASLGKAVVVDGFISAAAALVAVRVCPNVRDYLVGSHRSTEPGHDLTLQALGLTPLLDMKLRLGEGSGGALAIPMIRAAVDLLRDMATFESAGVSRSDSSA